MAVYLSSSCLEKKTSECHAPVDQEPHQITSLNYATPVIGMPFSGTGAVKSPVGLISQHPFPENALPDASAVLDKEVAERLVAVVSEGSLRQRGLIRLNPQH